MTPRSLTRTQPARGSDDGRLTDGQGRVVDFTQTLVLMTSNLRTDDNLKSYFRPEFLNRIDEVLTYDALKPEQLHAIVRVQLERLRAHLAEQEIQLEITDTAIDRLAEMGFDPEYGARPLKRVIQKHVQNGLADAILRGDLTAGDTAHVDWTGERFTVVPRAAEPVGAGAS